MQNYKIIHYDDSVCTLCGKYLNVIWHGPFVFELKLYYYLFGFYINISCSIGLTFYLPACGIDFLHVSQ